VYKVVLTTLAAKQLGALDRTVARRIQGAIELLSHNPYPPKATKLSGRDGYRVRVGDYRILYDVIDDQLIIRVLNRRCARAAFR
jgi:Cytotoxic translational repressor of toxin-antitoxin stability system